MNEEELFCKLFPEYAVNGKPLSPYFDLFESGYEQSEKRIEELEATNRRISDECHKLVGSLEKKQNEIVEFIGKVAFLENDLNNAKAQIEKMKRCENCQTVRDAEGNCYLLKDGKCKNKDKWELRR